MRRAITLFTLLVFTLSCIDSGNRRVQRTQSFNPPNQNGVIDRNNPNGPSGDNNNGGGGNNQDGDQTAGEFDHCSHYGTTSFQYNHAHLGSYNICQSETNETIVGIQIKEAIPNFQLCLIPTTHVMENGERRATYIGSPKCFQVNSADTSMTITFEKNRLGYQTRNLTGVMIMQDRPYYYPCPFSSQVLSVDAYLECMNVLAGLPPSYPPNPPACFNYSGAYCDAYLSVGQQYANYVDHPLD